jgi:FkbH-like protein
MKNRIVKQEVDSLIAARRPRDAVARLKEAWAADRSTATASLVVSGFDALREQVELQPFRLVVLRSFTLEPVIPFLRARGFLAGLDLRVELGEFNAYTQEVLDPSSIAYREGVDAVLVAVQSRDIAPDLWEGFGDLNVAEVSAAAARVSESLSRMVSKFRSSSAAALLVHSFEMPCRPRAGVLDAQRSQGQRQAWEAINSHLRSTIHGTSHAYVVDYDALVARRGADRWHDDAKWRAVRLPIAAAELDWMAAEWMRYVHPLAGRVAKVVALDLDNTLWGGVVGEEGLDGIKLGVEPPGAYFLDFQRALLDISRRGVLLALCSKNNLSDAMEVLETHPSMLLRPADFACIRINWQDKASNLRAIAKELNLGIDSIAFVDDNPAERHLIEEQLPEVSVLELPAEPADYARSIRDWPLLERLRVTEEDALRNSFYAQDRSRAELQLSADSMEDYYRSLGMRIEVSLMREASVSRTAQLLQKTNQFNLTTRRHSEEDLWRFMSDPSWAVFTLAASDRFGDLGQVGVAVVRLEGTICHLDSFLLSCRVIGRTIETAFLSCIIEFARTRGICKVRAQFIPTKKNAPSCGFLGSHGFLLEGEVDGVQEWCLEEVASIACPTWLDVTRRYDLAEERGSHGR